MSLAESTRHYWAEPTRATFLALQEQIQAAPNYNPHTSANEVAGPHLARGAYEEVVRQLRALLPGAFLSPALHHRLAFAYHQLGNTEAAVREARFTQAALDGILLTGDGSLAQPFHVLRIADEYDTLAHLGKRSTGQSLVQEGGRALDQHDCEDGSTIWFDISAFFAAAAGHPPRHL